jgi:hypothetical protein
MKNILTSLFIIFSSSFVYSQQKIDTLINSTFMDTVTTEKTYELVDGTIVSKSELDSIFNRAWEKSFGKMSESDKNILFDNVKYDVIIVDEK